MNERRRFVSTGQAVVVAVSSCPSHNFSKSPQSSIHLLQGRGVEGDAHAGVRVQHRSRLLRFGDAPNLRQVHLIHAELFDELRVRDFDIRPGQMGENITTRGIDLLGLSAGDRLRLGEDAVIEITGLRNPCRQLDRFAPGLRKAVLEIDDDGNLIRKAGIMAIVLKGGVVRPQDAIEITRRRDDRVPLQPV